MLKSIKLVRAGIKPAAPEAPIIASINLSAELNANITAVIVESVPIVSPLINFRHSDL